MNVTYYATDLSFEKPVRSVIATAAPLVGELVTIDPSFGSDSAAARTTSPQLYEVVERRWHVATDGTTTCEILLRRRA